MANASSKDEQEPTDTYITVAYIWLILLILTARTCACNVITFNSVSVPN